MWFNEAIAKKNPGKEDTPYMEDKLNQAADNPAATTDQATNESSSQTPNAAAEQGVGTATATDTTSQTESQTDTASQADTSQADDAQTETAPSESAPSDTSEVIQAEAIQEEARSTPDATTPPKTLPSEIDAPDDDNITMEDVIAASDEQMSRRPVHRGMIVTGTIIMLSQEGLVVDVGAKIEGVVPYNQLFDFDVSAEEAAKYFKPNDEIQVYVVRSDVPNNTIILSKKRADQERAWTLLNDIYEKSLPVEVEIVEKVRGGLVANLGVRAFLPASQVDIRRVNDLAPFVGKRIKVRIIELNRKRNRVIISRRSIIEDEIAGKKEETLEKLEPGFRTEGEVVEITDFGAFVNLGGIDGLVHRSELTHGRFNHPREVVDIGQKVKVEVLDMDIERERINLSMKKLVANPWENVLNNYSIGQKIEGKVTNLTSFGSFVEIEPGLEGLIHVSEMSWTKRIRHPKEVLTEGEDVEAMILKIDVSQERISLGLRQTQPDPWSSLPDRFPPGTEITGPITGITEFGVFMEIEEGIEGLVHISELAHEHIDDISQHFNRGDEITAVILNIDPIEQRASLSRKRLLPFTAGDEAAMPTGAPASRGGGRKGRRGGRRSQGIDYDYSYAAADTGAKTTTKLGDVYADLFAQFGLTEGKEGEEGEEGAEASAEASETAPESTEAAAEAPAAEASEAPAPEATEGEAETAEASAEAPATEEVEVQPSPEAQQVEAEAQGDAPIDPEAKKESPETTPEDAIDAAEAAALLTAAFRQGKRPAKQEEDNQEEKETSEA